MKHPDPMPVEDGGHWCHNPREDLRRGHETEAEDPELEGLPVQHEAKKTTRIVMNWDLKIRVLQVQGDHPVAWADGVQD